MSNQKLTFDLKETYLAMIKNSVGSKIFQSCFFRNEKGELIDVCQGGKFSCAVFVSFVLKRFDLIKTNKVVMASLEKELLRNCWFVVRDHQEFFWKVGSILVWEPKLASDGQKHEHIGFYMGNNSAISNSPDLCPAEHHVTYNCARRILRVYCHPFLEAK